RKEREATNRKPLDKKRKASSGAKATAEEKAKLPGPVVQDGKPVFGTKNGPSETGGLFDPPPDKTEAIKPTERHVSECAEIAGAEIEEGAHRSATKSEPLNYPD